MDNFPPKVLLPSAETHNSTFGRESLAVFLTVKHSRHFLEGRDFTVSAGHKSLSFALKSTSDKLNPRGIRHLDHISQFTLDIRYIDGSLNELADVLSTPSTAHVQLSPGVDLAGIAVGRRRVCSTFGEDVYGLQLQDLPLTAGNITVLFGVSTAIVYVRSHSSAAKSPLPPQPFSPWESSYR
ncbi:hypothetical protein SprV_0902666000 [Sparganum proliferum]